MAAVASLVTGVVASLLTPSPQAQADTQEGPLGLPVSAPIVADGSLDGAEDLLANE
ncbi:hypothetical protein [Streptomyces sp. MS2.AVA.5]|uniref:Uncharacterized protein n=1 Tax=Streptomyces achmelvichensis TaxID=3134111 RepID=A0ACC6Q6I1_9ACTN